jgi:hypothetical protein
VIPRKSTIMIPPSMASTARAFRTSGDLNAGTPSATASMPVRATAPEAKARSTRKAVSALTGATMGSTLARSTAGTPPAR